MKIAIGSDHGGYSLKEIIKEHLQSQGHELLDVGTHSLDSVDFPDYSAQVCQKLEVQEAELGILICGTGIGMSIAANKHKGIRAALVHDVYSSKMTRAHNNSNVLCMGARVIGDELAKMIVDTWLSTDFEGGRHQRRLDKLEGESC